MPAPPTGRNPPGAPSVGGAFFDDLQEDWQMFEWELCAGQGGWFFRLRSAANGQTIMHSETYSSKQAAEETLLSLSEYFGAASCSWSEVEA
jgi:uncharacterized protein YegP (UPF0339 family)